MAVPKISGDYELLGNFKLSNPSFTPSQNLALDSNGKVITVAGGNVSIGSIISGGAPNQVLYTDASSQLTQDAFYTRDILTKTDFHGYDNGGFLSGFFIDPNFNGQGVNFAGVKREGVGGSISAVGTADFTSIGGLDNNIVRFLSNGSSIEASEIQSEEGFDRSWQNTNTDIFLNERFGSTVGNHIINTFLTSNTNDTLEYIMDSDNGSMGVNKMFRWTWGDGSGTTHGFQLDSTGLGYFGTSGFEYYLPIVDGINKQFVKTDGAGNTAFANVTSMLQYINVVDQDHLVTSLEYYIMISALTNSRTISLPAANSVLDGHTVVIKDKDASAGTFNITVDAGTDFIDGSNSVLISTNYGKLTLVSDGVNTWSIV